MSGQTTTISSPAFLGHLITSTAAWTAVPELIPFSRPSSRISRRVIAIASSTETLKFALVIIETEELKRSIRKHHAEHRKRIEAWMAEQAQAGKLIGGEALETEKIGPLTVRRVLLHSSGQAYCGAAAGQFVGCCALKYPRTFC